MTEPLFKPRDCYNSNGNLKTRYHSKAEAKQALRRMVHRSPNGLPVQRKAKAYRCYHCGFFHIGHVR